jgi:hypothetical protein
MVSKPEVGLAKQTYRVLRTPVPLLPYVPENATFQRLSGTLVNTSPSGTDTDADLWCKDGVFVKYGSATGSARCAKEIKGVITVAFSGTEPAQSPFGHT